MFETSEETLDPEDWQALRRQGHQMLDDMFDYLESLRERPVWQPIPDDVRAGFLQPMPQASGDLAKVHERFMRDVLPYAIGNAHPGFMGWVHGGGTPVGMLAEMLAAGLNANLGGREQIPVEVERQLVRWVRELFSFPDTASGLFVTGTSMANLIGVLVARTRALGRTVREQGVSGDLVAYASASAHVSIAQAMDMAGFGSARLRKIPLDASYRMDTAKLEAAIAADVAAGRTPFLIAATAGTVDVGAIDPLDEISRIAERCGLWMHVDGAYGALGMLSPDIAPQLAGIERADSIAFDFHKWGQVPYDAGFVLVRDGELHYSAFASAAAYLQRQTRGMAAGSPWPCDYGPDLSRGFRALKTWFTIQVYGAQKLGRVISNTCAQARYLRDRVEAEPMLELLAPVALNIVCFCYRGDDSVNAQIVVALQESGIVAPSSTTIGGRLAIRAAIVNHRTKACDIDALIGAVLEFGAQIARNSLSLQGMKMDNFEQANQCDSLIGLVSLMRIAISGEDLGPLGMQLIARAGEDPRVASANALMDLCTVLQLRGNRDLAMDIQSQALALQQVYSPPMKRGTGDRGAAAIRLLAIMGPGDLMSNSPIEFLLEDADVALDILYVTPERDFPAIVPEHDVLFVAIAESRANAPLLAKVQAAISGWPKPVLNLPERIAELSRDRNCARLKSVAGLTMPNTLKLSREQLAMAGRGELALAELLQDGDFPIIVRPVDSHAGQDLQKLEQASDIAAYLSCCDNGEFYVSRFVDYRSGDGLFRKYRIVLIQGRPYLCHMGISDQWMIHYMNAGMDKDAGKRAEEAALMLAFDGDFAVRHAAALQAIDDRFGLDYLGIDCAETADGSLLVFEVDSCMVVHAVDPVDLFPYKLPQMQRVFDAFFRMLVDAAKPV